MVPGGETDRPAKREHWASRAGFIMAAAGSAVGLGNVWKFPYMAGENGGGAFVIVYLPIVFTIGISVLLAELIIGRAAQKDPVGAFRMLGRRPWPLVGFMGILAAFLILSFYGVVAGWTLAFAVKMATGVFSVPGADPATIFGAFIGAPLPPLLYAAAFMALTAWVVLGGIGHGIERANLVLMPLLFVILVALVARAVTLPGAMDGLMFFVRPDFSKVTGATFTAALGQAFFSLSVGLGAMITYGSYLDRKQNIGRSATSVVGLDTLAAILAGLVIFPAVFAAGVDPGAGPGLVFVTLPSVFTQMPGGQVFGALFFVLLAIAALTSAVSLLEPVVAFFMDEYGFRRARIAVVTGGAAFLLGIPSSLSMGPWADATLFGKGFLDLLAFVTSSIMLPVGGLLIAVFVGWVMGPRAIAELKGEEATAPALARAWLTILRFVAPLAIAWILVNELISTG